MACAGVSVAIATASCSGTFTFVTKTPPTSFFLKRAAKIEILVVQPASDPTVGAAEFDEALLSRVCRLEKEHAMQEGLGQIVANPQ